MAKIYHKPPLPFNGNKSKWIANLEELINTKHLHFPKGTYIVDLFGGSGILSQLFGKAFPDCHVVYNDFDHYTEIITKGSIDKINSFIEKLRKAFENKKYNKNDKLSDADAITARKIVKSFWPKMIGDPSNKYKNDIYLSPKEEKIKNVVCSQICFSGRFNLEGDLYYKLTNGYEYIPDYLSKNIIVTHEDYKTLYNRYKNKENVFFVMDPPYLSTSKSFYSNYWGIEETAKILDICINSKAILFESPKSEIIPLIKLIHENMNNFYFRMSEPRKLFNKSSNEEYCIWFNYKKYLDI